MVADPVDEIRSHLEQALEATRDERAFHLRQATQLLDFLDRPDINRDERPPEGVRWINEDRGIVEVELSDELIEWIDLEVGENNTSHTIEDWIHTQIVTALAEDLQKNHGPTVTPEIELPADFVHRARLLHNDVGEGALLEEIFYNHMDLSPTFLLDGEPIGADRSDAKGGDVDG